MVWGDGKPEGNKRKKAQLPSGFPSPQTPTVGRSTHKCWSAAGKPFEGHARFAAPAVRIQPAGVVEPCDGARLLEHGIENPFDFAAGGDDSRDLCHAQRLG